MRKTCTERISARIPADIAQKLEQLLACSGDNLSELIIKAIESYYHSEMPQRSVASEVLRSNKFIACAESSERLSCDYKKIFSKSLNQKL